MILTCRTRSLSYLARNNNRRYFNDELSAVCHNAREFSFNGPSVVATYRHVFTIKYHRSDLRLDQVMTRDNKVQSQPLLFRSTTFPTN